MRQMWEQARRSRELIEERRKIQEHRKHLQLIGQQRSVAQEQRRAIEEQRKAIEVAWKKRCELRKIESNETRKETETKRREIKSSKAEKREALEWQKERELQKRLVFSKGMDDLNEAEIEAIKVVEEQQKNAPSKSTQSHWGTARNHLQKFLNSKDMIIEDIMEQDASQREAAVRIQKCVRLFLFYLQHTVKAKAGVGVGPVATIVTYTEEAFRQIAKDLEQKLEFTQATIIRKLVKRETTAYGIGRERSLIGIRGVLRSRHKAPIGYGELEKFWQCHEIWSRMKPIEVTKMEVVFSDLFFNGHRRQEVCPKEFSGFRHLSRADIQFYYANGQEPESYEVRVLLELSRREGSYAWVGAPPTSKGDPLGKRFANRGNGNAHPFDGEDAFALKLLKQEVEDPITDKKQRKKTAAFNRPGSQEPYNDKFVDELFIQLIIEMCKKFYGLTLTEQEARDVFGLHSFRIGLVVALMKLGASDEVIKSQGRWASEAFRVYFRPDASVSSAVSKLLQSSTITAHTERARAVHLPTLGIKETTKITLVRNAMSLTKVENEKVIASRDQNGQLVLPRVTTKGERVEEETPTAEMMRPTEREPNEENWKEVIPVGRKVRKKFKVKGKYEWFEGTIKAVETEEEYPVEVKFEDDMQESWTFKEFAKEVEKGTVQLMR